jgi:WD40 repeat protein
VVLSFENWKGAKVNPTTHAVTVLPVKTGAKAEPVSPLLTATLVHPDRKANIGQVKYSADGKRLFVSGYPSGVVQVFDVEAKKELRRFDTPKGYRGSMEYALLTPDWKTLYVTDENKRKVVPVEVDGKKDYRIEYSGHILAWDVTTGKPLDSLPAEKNHGAGYAKLSPDGRWLLVVEERTVLASQRDGESRVTFAWDLTAGTKAKLGDGYLVPTFLPDGKTALLVHSDYAAKTSVLKRIDLATGKVLASRETPEKGLSFQVVDVSSDGKLAAACLTGKKGMKPLTHLFDAETLKDVDVLTGEANPEQYGYQAGTFTPDAKKYVTSDGKGEYRVWDVAAKKVVRTVKLGDWSWRQQVSPDGKWLAVAWMPNFDEVRAAGREPDPLDLPQPRVTLYNMADETAKPVVLICPHGFVGSLAFRPDGQQLAFGSAGGVHLFDLTKRK